MLTGQTQLWCKLQPQQVEKGTAHGCLSVRLMVSKEGSKHGDHLSGYAPSLYSIREGGGVAGGLVKEAKGGSTVLVAAVIITVTATRAGSTWHPHLSLTS